MFMRRTISNWLRKFSRLLQAGKTVACQFLFLSDWSKFDRWVHAENLCNILKLIYFDSWSWQFSVNLQCFNCLFPLDVQIEIQLLSKVFCYSWLVCLLGFWLRNEPLIKVGNPTFGWHQAILALAFRSWISNGKGLHIFWPQIERKRSEEYLVIILAVNRKLWAIFLPWVHLDKNQTSESRLKT